MQENVAQGPYDVIGTQNIDYYAIYICIILPHAKHFVLSNASDGRMLRIVCGLSVDVNAIACDVFDQYVCNSGYLRSKIHNNRQHSRVLSLLSYVYPIKMLNSRIYDILYMI